MFTAPGDIDENMKKLSTCFEVSNLLWAPVWADRKHSLCFTFVCEEIRKQGVKLIGGNQRSFRAHESHKKMFK